MNKPYDLNPNFTNKVILSASRTSNCVTIRTWDLKHRWSKNLYISANVLECWLHGDHTERFLDDDMDSIVRFYHSNDNDVNVEILWMDTNHREDVSGYKQTFYIPVSFLHKAVSMESGYSSRCLGDIRGHVGQSQLVFSHRAHAQISDMTVQEKNTLRKALRYVFTYGRRSVIHIHAEYGVDFYFHEEHTGINGGLLMNKTVVRGKDGKLYPKHSYSVHT